MGGGLDEGRGVSRNLKLEVVIGRDAFHPRPICFLEWGEMKKKKRRDR